MCFQKQHILQYIQNVLQRQHQTLLDVTQDVSKQCADMRTMLLDMQHQVNQIEDTARQVVTSATQEHFAAIQHIQQYFNTQPTASSSDTSFTTKSDIITQPTPGSSSQPQSRSYTEVTATQPLVQPEIAASRIPAPQQPRPQTSQRRKLHPLIRDTKKMKHDHPSDILFISDSIFKFLIEDKVTFNYILQNDHEQNIRLFRGHSATQVVQATIEHLTDTPLRGITTMVSTFGTVDLTHICRADFEPAQVAHNVIDSVKQLSDFAQQSHYTFLYLLPGYIAGLTSAQYNTFRTTAENALKAHNIAFIRISDIMTQLASPVHTTLDTIVQHTTHDGIHLTFDTGQETLKHILAHFQQTCTLSTPTLNKEYYVAQKYLPVGCYKCGDKRHSKQRCPHATVTCDWCQSNMHTQQICPLKLLPCTHCAQFGHYRGNKRDCPLWKKRVCDTDLQHMSLDDTTQIKHP